MSIIKSFSVDKGDTFYIKHGSKMCIRDRSY